MHAYCGETRTELKAGDEFVIPKGTTQSMEVSAGTRTKSLAENALEEPVSYARDAETCAKRSAGAGVLIVLAWHPRSDHDRHEEGAVHA